MKLIYLTDIHFGATPVCRKDNYNLSILDKLSRVFDCANKNHINTILIGGDLFDRPQQSYPDLISIFNLFSNQIKKHNTKFYINRGNPTHDGNKNNSPLTLLASMNKNNFFLSDDYDSVDIEDTNISLVFVPNDMDLTAKDFSCYNAKNKKYFVLTHHILVNETVPYKHILCSDLVKNLYKCKTVFIADYHPQQGIIEIDGYRFISSGSLCRRKFTKDNITKCPSFYIYDSETDDFELQTLSVETDIWNTPEDTVIEKTELDMEGFKNNITDFQDDMNIVNAWESFAEINNIPTEYYDLISKKIKG